MPTYKSDIKLGAQYRDKQTGFVGHATAVHFYEHACERVSLKTLADGQIKEYAFDSPELESIETGKTARATKPGGPRDRTPFAPLNAEQHHRHQPHEGEVMDTQQQIKVRDIALAQALYFHNSRAYQDLSGPGVDAETVVATANQFHKFLTKKES